jgi:hypothetical protein
VRLIDLDPYFIHREIRPCHPGAPGCSTVSPHTEHEYHVPVADLEQADGVMLLCPKCWQASGGPVGTHRVLCWRPRVPADISPKPGRWEFHGTGLGDLTLVAGSSSILLTAGCQAHFFIRDGAIVW